MYIYFSTVKNNRHYLLRTSDLCEQRIIDVYYCLYSDNRKYTHNLTTSNQSDSIFVLLCIVIKHKVSVGIIA